MGEDGTQKIDVFFFFGDLGDELLQVFFRGHVAGSYSMHRFSPPSYLFLVLSRETGRAEPLRYYFTFVLRTVILCCILKNFHAAARDVDFGPWFHGMLSTLLSLSFRRFSDVESMGSRFTIGGQGLRCHQANASATSCDNAHITLNREKILDLELMG